MESKQEFVYASLNDDDQDTKTDSRTVWFWSLYQALVHMILHTFYAQYLIEFYKDHMRKPIRKNWRGIKRNTKKTFKKLFGTSKSSGCRKKKGDSELSAKFITDKILSDSMSGSENSDSDGAANSTQYYSFSVSTDEVSSESVYRKLE